MLSTRMTNKVIGQGHVGTRIVWVRIKGPVFNLMYIVTYVPHKGRTEAPQAEDTIQQLTHTVTSTIVFSTCNGDPGGLVSRYEMRLG